MVHCVAYQCKSRSEKKELGVTFHRFPAEPTKRQLWIEATKILNLQPTKNDRLCSKHFEERFFYETDCTRRLLNAAVPTIFPEFPTYMQPKKILKRSRASNLDSQPGVSSTSCQPDNQQVEESPRKKRLRRQLFQQVEKNKRKTKKIKVLKQKLRRYKKKVISLKLVIKELKKQNLLSSESLLIFDSMPDIAKELQKRHLKKKSKYSPELRKFAITLSFFSPKGYDYVRQVFNTCLPHRSTIGKWFKTVNAEPGFTKEAFETLKKYVTVSTKTIILSLIVDEISLRKHVEWDGKKYHGYINYGMNLDNDLSEIAKEAFVLMVVGVNTTWKLPIGYFFSNGLSGTQKCAIVTQCITLIYETGAHLLSLTFDGAPSNVTMAHMLGCRTDFYNLKPCFTINQNNVYIIFDPSHMIKLIRNTFGEKKILKDGEGNFIRWEFLEKLDNLQSAEGLHLGNKLRKAHLHFAKQKMKVRLAVQLLSQSVADALDYCQDELGLEEFQSCSATIKFIRIINNVFDILNSRSLNPPGFKKALFEKNFENTKRFIGEAINYLSNLKINDELVINSNRKTGFLGFIISLKSALLMYDDMVCEQKKLIYVPMYKVSQDHIELFFSSIRSRGGWNNNPTCRQFTAAYKRLLVRTEVREGGMSNCVPLEDIPILVGSSRAQQPEININSSQLQLITDEPERSFSLQTLWCDHDYIMNPLIISACSLQIVTYIAGFVSFHLQKSLKCESCLSAIIGEKANFLNSLICKKSKGGLTYPSQDVINICKISEHFIRVYEKELQNNRFVNLLKSRIMHQAIDSNYFSCLKDHAAENSNNHIYFLIEAIILKYLNIRLHFIAKKLSEVKDPIRQQYTKLILFKGQ